MQRGSAEGTAETFSKLLGQHCVHRFLLPCRRWIYLGSANANFYYAITLLFGAWQVLSDPLSRHLRLRAWLSKSGSRALLPLRGVPLCALLEEPMCETDGRL